MKIEKLWLPSSRLLLMMMPMILGSASIVSAQDLAVRRRIGQAVRDPAAASPRMLFSGPVDGSGSPSAKAAAFSAADIGSGGGPSFRRSLPAGDTVFTADFASFQVDVLNDNPGRDAFFIAVLSQEVIFYASAACDPAGDGIGRFLEKTIPLAPGTYLVKATADEHSVQSRAANCSSTATVTSVLFLNDAVTDNLGTISNSSDCQGAAPVPAIIDGCVTIPAGVNSLKIRLESFITQCGSGDVRISALTVSTALPPPQLIGVDGLGPVPAGTPAVIIVKTDGAAAVTVSVSDPTNGATILAASGDTTCDAATPPACNFSAPPVTGNTTGNYTVTVVLASPCTAPNVYAVPLVVNGPPVARCKRTVVVRVNEVFDIDAGTSDPEGDSFRTTRSGPRSFPSVGQYSVGLTVEDEYGRQSSCSTRVVVVAAPNPAPRRRRRRKRMKSMKMGNAGKGGRGRRHRLLSREGPGIE